MRPAGLNGLVSSLITRFCQSQLRCQRSASAHAAAQSGYRHSLGHVLRMFLFCVCQGISPNVLYQCLKRRGPGRASYRRAHRLPNRMISLSQLKKRLRTPEFQQALAGLLAYSARRALREVGPDEEIRILAMDLTDLTSDPDQDPQGAWGFSSQGYFWGYKLGLIISRHGVVLGMTLTKANWVELTVSRRLVRMARNVVASIGNARGGEVAVEYLLCDSGFDGEATYRSARRELGATVLCPSKHPPRDPQAHHAQQIQRRARRRSPFREEARRVWEQLPQRRELYRHRVEVERVNGQIKDTPLSINRIPPRRRGVNRLRPLCLGKLILYNLALYANARERLPLRAIKAQFA